MADVAMPRLSDSMEEGTILKWLKSEGDEVKRGDELVEIETDKANMTYEADQDGTLQIVAQEGDTLPVGETMRAIGGAAAGRDGAASPSPRRRPSRSRRPRGASASPAAAPRTPPSRPSPSRRPRPRPSPPRRPRRPRRSPSRPRRPRAPTATATVGA